MTAKEVERSKQQKRELRDRDLRLEDTARQPNIQSLPHPRQQEKVDSYQTQGRTNLGYSEGYHQGYSQGYGQGYIHNQRPPTPPSPTFYGTSV